MLGLRLNHVSKRGPCMHHEDLILVAGPAFKRLIWRGLNAIDMSNLRIILVIDG